jgi:ferritin-like metal-binding protein YciE
MKTMQDAFEHTLADIYYAEGALVKALPKMAKAVGNADLKAAFTGHLEETKHQIEVLKQVFQSIGLKPKGEKCDAIEGLIKEASGLMEEATGEALDTTLLAAGQAVEHYEIARYTSLSNWAVMLGHTTAQGLLQGILDQETAADKKLATINTMMGAGDVTGKAKTGKAAK